LTDRKIAKRKKRNRRRATVSGWSLFSVEALMDQMAHSQRTPTELREQLRALVADDVLWNNLDDAAVVNVERRAIAGYIQKRLAKVMG
jgi:hypothetical protein